jgi:hypothetical protein
MSARDVPHDGSRITVKYDKHITALLVIDPYNDFISEGGKIWERLRSVAEANNCIPHMMAAEPRRS